MSMSGSMRRAGGTGWAVLVRGAGRAQQRPASMQACTVSIFSLVTSDVPVSTFDGAQRVRAPAWPGSRPQVGLQERLLVDGDVERAVLDALRRLGADVEGRDRDVEAVLARRIAPAGLAAGLPSAATPQIDWIGLQRGADQAKGSGPGRRWRRDRQ